jgi:hypothetical protein
MTSLHSALTALRAPLMSKASNVAKAYLESGRFMSGYLAGRMLRKDAPQRLLLSEQFSALESQGIDYGPLWGKNGSGQFSIEKGFWKDIDKACASSLAGYIPYVKGNTKVGVHHFWSVNYGLRKQLLGHIVLIKGGAFVASSRFMLPAYHFAVIDLEDVFGLQDGDGVYVEVYHPKIPKGHGGHSGHLRYWGIYGDHLSTVHSLPVQKISFRQTAVRSSRGTFPGEDLVPDLVKSFSHWGGQQRVLPSSLKHFPEATPFGFYLIDRGKEMPATIWHSAAYTAAQARPGARIQAVAFPPVPAVDVVMSFVEAIGSTGKVDFLLYKDSGLIDHVSRSIGPEDQLLASQLFPSTDLSGGVLVVDFSDHGQCIHSGYVHLIYRVANHTCDCVHSHWLHASRFRSPGKDQTGSKSGAGQSLKFMHFPATDVYQSWLAVWTLDESVPVKLRFLAANGKEHVLNIEIPPVGVCYLNVSELFLQAAGGPCKHVVVQLESGFANLDANLYTYSSVAKSLSVDHFTGG